LKAEADGSAEMARYARVLLSKLLNALGDNLTTRIGLLRLEMQGSPDAVAQVVEAVVASL
jgi:hypothetical protein